MALKATIHKAGVSFSDLDRNVYADHEITLARHPSETEERMMVRLLAWVLNASENNDHGTLAFGKDMWEPEEPSLVQNDLTGLRLHEIEIGQPEEKRLVRACGRSLGGVVGGRDGKTVTREEPGCVAAPAGGGEGARRAGGSHDDAANHRAGRCDHRGWRRQECGSGAGAAFRRGVTAGGFLFLDFRTQL